MFNPRDEARDRDGRADGRERVYDERDRDDDPREGLMRALDLPRGEERELVVVRDRIYELDCEDSRTLAAVGAFRVVPEHDLDAAHGSLEHLHEQGLVKTVDLGDNARRLTLTREGRHLLESHSLDREDRPSQVFYAGVSREREVDHDSNLYATYRQVNEGVVSRWFFVGLAPLRTLLLPSVREQIVHGLFTGLSAQMDIRLEVGSILDASRLRR